ncbi:MAG TPA: RodZ domain-containing protein, partial [Dokdonella sp.]|uniref:helix-turn-helix domain-containing protein n=1 Tax=Dokdonella sp. TaxID=2291710 RepID=UPI002B9173EB
EGSLGQHLRAAREAKGWTRDEVAARLKLPVRLIARIEADDYQGMTQGVYLRGYLISYTRLLGLPVARAEQVADLHTEATPIVATGTVPRSRYLLDRYSVTATYLILTGLILGPTVWFAATRGGIEQSLVRTTPLDTAAVRPSASSGPATTDTIAAVPVEVTPTPLAPPRIEAPPPVVASMAPFSTRPATVPAPVPSAAPAEAGRTLVLKVSQASWVEVLDADGRRLEYGLLQAGTERSYRSERPLSVRLGNADGVELQADGAVVDLAPYRRANVAHVRVFGPDATVARIEP